MLWPTLRQGLQHASQLAANLACILGCATTLSNMNTVIAFQHCSRQAQLTPSAMLGSSTCQVSKGSNNRLQRGAQNPNDHLAATEPVSSSLASSRPVLPLAAALQAGVSRPAAMLNAAGHPQCMRDALCKFAADKHANVLVHTQKGPVVPDVPAGVERTHAALEGSVRLGLSKKGPAMPVSTKEAKECTRDRDTKATQANHKGGDKQECHRASTDKQSCTQTLRLAAAAAREAKQKKRVQQRPSRGHRKQPASNVQQSGMLGRVSPRGKSAAAA